MFLPERRLFMGVSYYVVLRHLALTQPRLFYTTAVLCILVLLGSYALLFHRMGISFFWAFIPFVNEWKLFEAVWGDGYFSLFQYVPYLGFCFRWIMLYKSGRAFGKTGAAMVFSVLVPTAARFWFALGRADYLGPEGRPQSENPYRFDRNIKLP